jgi:tRNA A37 threonylcarbamoyladenosine biosynthesis protein TsaE
VNTYYFKNEVDIWHCDFYRIDSFNEVEEIGVFEDLKKKLFF